MSAPLVHSGGGAGHSGGGPGHSGGGAGPLAPAAPAEDARGRLLSIAGSTLWALVALVPRALWRGVKGMFGGFFLMGLVGLAVAGAAALAGATGLLAQPRWLVFLNLGWVPFVFAVAGGYAGAVTAFSPPWQTRWSAAAWPSACSRS